MSDKYKVLIVDDNQIDRLVAGITLQNNFDISDINEVGSVNEGINWLMDYKKSPEESLIILLDIDMPGKDGFDFLEDYEKMDEGIKEMAQIYMLSSTLDPKDITRADSNPHVKSLLSKPLSVEELSRYIKV